VQITLPRLTLLHGEYALVAYLADERGQHIYHSQSLGGKFLVEQTTRDVGVVFMDHQFSAEPLPWPSAAERAAEDLDDGPSAMPRAG
jgi:hypothetical protein